MLNKVGDLDNSSGWEINNILQPVELDVRFFSSLLPNESAQMTKVLEKIRELTKKIGIRPGSSIPGQGGMIQRIQQRQQQSN